MGRTCSRAVWHRSPCPTASVRTGSRTSGCTTSSSRLIETERLLLRPVVREDLDAWAAFLADPLATGLLHFPEPHSREQSESLLDRSIARAVGEVAMYTVHVREGGATAGFVGYAPRTLEWGDELELGWLLLRDFHGHGFATEAAVAVRALVPGRVISLIRIENEASQNVARKISMTRERDIDFAGYRTHVFTCAAP